MRFSLCCLPVLESSSTHKPLELSCRIQNHPGFVKEIKHLINCEQVINSHLEKLLLYSKLLPTLLERQ